MQDKDPEQHNQKDYKYSADDEPEVELCPNRRGALNQHIRRCTQQKPEGLGPPVLPTTPTTATFKQANPSGQYVAACFQRIQPNALFLLAEVSIEREPVLCKHQKLLAPMQGAVNDFGAGLDQPAVIASR